MIFRKQMEIASVLKAPKGQYNSFGKYHYRSREDILEAVKPLLVEHECSLLESDEIVQIGDRFYVKASATLTEWDSGESVTTVAYAREDETKKGQDGSQITGTASSYARKYALNALFLIDDTKDADTEEHARAQKGYSKPLEKRPTFMELFDRVVAELCDGDSEGFQTHLKQTLGMDPNKQFDKSRAKDAVDLMEVMLQTGTVNVSPEDMEF